MRKLKEYILISRSNENTFMESINRALSQVFELYGNPYSSICEDKIFDNQAMVKYEDDVE